LKFIFLKYIFFKKIIFHRINKVKKKKTSQQRHKTEDCCKVQTQASLDSYNSSVGYFFLSVLARRKHEKDGYFQVHG